MSETKAPVVPPEETLAVELTHAAIACILDKNDYTKAQAALQQVVMLVSPFGADLPLALDQLGTVCYRGGRLTEACHFLQRALQLKRCSDLYKSSASLAATLKTLATVLRAVDPSSTQANDYDTEAKALIESIFACKPCPGK